MIVNTKTGLIVGGQLIKDAQVRDLSTEKQKLAFSLRYGYEEPTEPNTRHGAGKLLDVDIWDGIKALDGMLEKGDTVIAVADEVRSREYNGKTYRSINPSGVFVSAAVTLRWMQQLVDIVNALEGEVDALRGALGQAGITAPAQQQQQAQEEPENQVYSNMTKPEETVPHIDESEDLPF